MQKPQEKCKTVKDLESHLEKEYQIRFNHGANYEKTRNLDELSPDEHLDVVNFLLYQWRDNPELAADHKREPSEWIFSSYEGILTAADFFTLDLEDQKSLIEISPLPAYYFYLDDTDSKDEVLEETPIQTEMLRQLIKVWYEFHFDLIKNLEDLRLRRLKEIQVKTLEYQELASKGKIKGFI